MATYWVVCITKHPTHQDAHRRIQAIGTSETRGATNPTKKWSVDDVIAAIRRGDIFYCTDAKGDVVKVIVATHNGNPYVKTEPDGIQPDNLLRQRECP